MAMDVKGKKITVAGLGNSGFHAAMLLAKRDAEVKATDSSDSEAVRDAARQLKGRGVKVETGVHTEDFVKGSELIVLSPGIEESSPVVRWAGKYKIPITGEMELGYRFCKGKIIAITGTNGKSTVTALTGEMLKASGMDTVVCGNIGNCLSGEIDRITNRTLVVLEVSSFQLERSETFRPHISVILNITDDHMDRYKRSSDYYSDKLKIFRNQRQGDFVALNFDAENLRCLKIQPGPKTFFYSRLANTDGAYVDNAQIVFAAGGRDVKVLALSDAQLKGAHNIENILASTLIAMLAGASPQAARDAVKNFKPLSHRFEEVAVIDGVRYVDDSKGTTVDSTRRALESCDAPVILIAGGKDKFSDYSAVRELFRNKLKLLILIGEARRSIRMSIGEIVRTVECDDMSGAVKTAAENASKGDIVLLSPMCSSFDMYKSYKERGEIFAGYVKSLRGEYRGAGSRA